MSDSASELDDRRLDEAFDRIVASRSTQLSQETVVRLLVLLANGIAVQRDTALVLAGVASGEADNRTIDGILQKIEDSREGFKRMVVELADGTAEGVA